MKYLICVIGLAAIWPGSAAIGGVESVKLRPFEEELNRVLRADIPEKIRFEVHSVSSDGAPANAHIGRVSPHPPFGRIQFELEWDEAGREHRTFGSATVRAYTKVAVARTNIRHGDVLEGNINFEERELSPYVHSGYIMDADLLKNLRANGFIRPGELLNSGNTAAPFSVVAGEMLDIIHNQGPVQITARVRALGNGRINDWIRVENPGTKKVIMAKVTGPGEAQTR